MASLRDIRRRIKSVKNTSQITKAMEMVAASKMRKAQQAALNGRPYALELNKVLVSLRDRVDSSLHPLLAPREGGKELVILLSTDKGLCGGLNANLFREVVAHDRDNTEFVSIGRKGTQFLARAGYNMIADFPLRDQPAFLETKKVSAFAMDRYLKEEIGKVSVLFPRFVNTLTQITTKIQLLPIASLEEMGLVAEEDSSPKNDGFLPEMLIEPDPYTVLDAMLPFYVHYELYQVLLATRASEHSARMVAMKNATDNAKQLVKDLDLEYNKARQAAITKEILEISTAQLALS